MGSVASRLLTALLLAVGLLLALAWLSRPQPVAAGSIPAHRPDLANGERLFHGGGCASCHGAELAGGEDMVTRFGTFRAPNITPDLQAGIGGWSAADFVSAMKRGVSPDGRHYYPAFPYTSYTRMEITDLLDLWAYLGTVPPRSSGSRDHDLAFPWNLRRGIGLWKRFYLDEGWVADLPDSDERARAGRYLAEGAGHCGECHTPRGRAGGWRPDRWMAGGVSPEGEGRVPNITPHADGLADWSDKDLLRYLKSGFTPDYDVVGGSMAKVQENLAQLPDEDLEALVAYLKALPARPDAAD